jgi:hypothetical protein
MVRRRIDGAVARLKAAGIALLVLLAAGCAVLPDYARPRMHPGDPQQPAHQGFAYRTLTPADFRSPAPPDHLGGHAERINAHSAIRIRPTPASRFAVAQGELYGQPYFFGRIEHLAFEAVMIPERSWWNPAMPAAATAYVLQHEQIHFALTEIAARRLTREAAAWASEQLVIRPSPQEVHSEIVRWMTERVNAAMEAGLKRHAEFDEDTSLFYNPRRQRWWSWTVEDELRETQPAGAQGETAAP